MTQYAVVTRELEQGKAMVSVSRHTACGGNCENCESCISQSSLNVVAENSLKAHKGDQVVIESKSSRIYRAIALVYVLPMVLLLLFYFLSFLAGASESVCILFSFLGLLVGGLCIYLSKGRYKSNPISYTIVQIIER